MDLMCAARSEHIGPDMPDSDSVESRLLADDSSGPDGDRGWGQ